MGEQLTAGQVFRLGQHTLWVILGPLTASVDWAKKTKVKVRITKREMTTLWKLAMIDGMSNYSSNWFEREREIEGEETGSSTALHIAEKTSIDLRPATACISRLGTFRSSRFTLIVDDDVCTLRQPIVLTTHTHSTWL